MDWTIMHNGDTIEIELEDGTKGQIQFDEYKAEVLKFADMVEAFYNACMTKVLPKDIFDRNGYIAFLKWMEQQKKSLNLQWLPLELLLLAVSVIT